MSKAIKSIMINNHKYSIVNDGMGGFLNPPGDAEHYRHLKAEYSYHSLRGALKDEHIPEEVKDLVRQTLSSYKGIATEEWIKQVYKYFGRCYSPDGIDRDVNHCLIYSTNTADKCRLENHLAYLHVKQFFPDYPVRLDLIPEAAEIAEARELQGK